MAVFDATVAGRPNIERPDCIAVGLTSAIIVVAIVWNAFAGIQFSPPLWAVVWIPVSMVALAAFHAIHRPAERRIIGVALYTGLWLLYMIFAVRISYFAVAADAPLQDRLFSSLDAALGFHWSDWNAFLGSRPFLARLLTYAYESYYPQAFISIWLLACVARANARFLIATIIAFAIVVCIAGFLPAFGPAYSSHVFCAFCAYEPIIAALRSGKNGPFICTGILTFPSFHAVMACVYVLVHRGNGIRFAIFSLLNAVMLVSILAAGGHYLCDVIAGLLVAVASWLIAEKIIDASPPSRWSHGVAGQAPSA